MSKAMRQWIISSRLDSSGRPLNPKSIFVGLRKETLATVRWMEAMKNKTLVAFPYRFIGRWDVFTCWVEQINQFPDGTIILAKPKPGSTFENWPVVPIWIPNVGSAGILS